MNKDLGFMLYCHEDYAKVQHFQSYHRFHSDHIVFCVECIDNKAICLPKSPIGGFTCFNGRKSDFLQFYEKSEKSLAQNGVSSLEITLPPHYYTGVPDRSWLEQLGFSERVSEVAHYISINGPLWEKIHTMQQRKLKQTPTFDLSLVSVSELRSVYDFIAQCRKNQGLEINMDFEILERLFRTFPDRYQIFTAERNGTLLAAAIMVIPIEGIAYYFLPATAPAYKTESPMVHLIAYLYQYYQERGFQYIDLGISSVNAAPQKSLITFKERMGGIRTTRSTFIKSLQ